VINTNLPHILHRFQVMVKFSKARGECLTSTLALGVIACQYRHKWYIAKTRFFDLHFCCRKYWCNAVQGHPRSPSLVPIESSLCDFLLVINTNLAAILHRFRDIAFDRSKIAIFGYPSCV